MDGWEAEGRYDIKNLSEIHVKLQTSIAPISLVHSFQNVSTNL